MKYFYLLICSALILPFPSQAQSLDAQLETVLNEACITMGEKYEHNGIKLGMSERGLVKLGSESAKVNFPSAGSSSVLVEDKTLIVWSTPETPEHPLYRIDYERGAMSPFSLEEAQAFTEEMIASFGEPKIKNEGAGYHNEGYPQLNYSADQAVKKEQYQPIENCLRQHREISPYEKMALAHIKPRNFETAFSNLQTLCPDQVDAYIDYMIYSLQPEVNVNTSKAKFRIEMTCPAYREIKAIRQSKK